MYPGSNLQPSVSGERRSSYQHYSMSQVNNEKPLVNREQEEQVQTWGQPPSSAAAYPPQSIDSERHFSHGNQLTSSASSVFDRQANAMDNAGYQQQAYSNQYRTVGQSAVPQMHALQQEQQHHRLQQQQQQQQSAASSSYSKVSNMTTQEQSGSQRIHDVPYFHGFKFQTLPGFFFAL